MPRSEIGRREFLGTGLSAAGATILGLAASGCTDRLTAPVPVEDATRPVTADPPADLPEPRVVASAGGVLTTALVAATNPTMVGGRLTSEPVTYDGTFPGPTLLVHPGDTIDLTFTNRIVHDQAENDGMAHGGDSNVHFHGMHVSPTGTADNMWVVVPKNGSHRYLFQVPANHPAGLFWYHAHVHGTVTNQVSRGAAGMLYVSNAYTDHVAQLGIRRRLMLLQQAYVDVDDHTLIFDDGARDDPSHALSLINGALTPDIRMRPGEPQVWSLLNGSSSAFYLLRLEGHTFDVIAEDGIPLRAPGRPRQSTLLLASGQRVEVVVRATGTPGRYALRYDAFDQGVDTWPAKTVGTVVVEGAPYGGARHPGVDTTTRLENLAAGRPDLQRTIVFGQNDAVPEGEFGRFTINGHSWDPSYREWASTLGAVEEWHVVNETAQDHPFHVHTNPFQIVRINGSAVPFDGYRDTAVVPRFGTLTLRTRFTDFTGGPVLIHCHILDHEDMGMMIYFDVV